MTDAFDLLEAQLRAATREHAQPEPIGRWRWRRRAAGLAVLLALGGGGAAAVAQLTASPDEVQQGRRDALQAIQATAGTAACRPARSGSGGVALTKAAALPAIRSAVPGLEASTPAQRQAALRQLPAGAGTAGPVLERTLRPVSFANGVTGVVYVQMGGGLQRPADPAACASARRGAVIRMTADEPPAVSEQALRRLAAARDTRPGLQTFWVLARSPGERVLGGGGTVVDPGAPGPSGLLEHSSPAPGASDRRSLYVGLVDRRARTVLVSAARRPSGTPRTASRAGALWSVLLPPGTGTVRLLQRDSAGRMLKSTAVR